MQSLERAAALLQAVADAHLAVRSNTDIVLIARVAAAGMLQMAESTGIVRPAHAPAVGKLLLTECDDDVLDPIPAGLELPALTTITITERDRLREELEQVRSPSPHRSRPPAAEPIR
jgi:IclR family acetate operon transcriptional repressor